MPSTTTASPCAKCGDAPRASSHSYCRSCRNAYQNAYRRRRYQTEPQYRERTISQGKARKYGISREQFSEMLGRQGGACAICEIAPADDKSLCVDHCHTTGKVRGLLCERCNGAIGMMRDDRRIIERAAEYISAHGR